MDDLIGCVLLTAEVPFVLAAIIALATALRATHAGAPWFLRGAVLFSGTVVVQLVVVLGLIAADPAGTTTMWILAPTLALCSPGRAAAVVLVLAGFFILATHDDRLPPDTGPSA